MISALDELTDILSDESNVSAFELHSSGLVQVLLHFLQASLRLVPVRPSP